jgi:beta-glucosidase
MKKLTKKILLTLIISLFVLPLTTCTGTASEKKDAAPVAWNTLEELLAQMTLAEKIGQMTQAERGDISRADVRLYGLGSVLSGGGSVPPSNTPEGWLGMFNSYAEESLKTRLGIPYVYGIDAVHGHNNALNATILPHNIALGAIAAGNMEKGRQAAYTAGRITAEEMIATGVRWTFAPVLGVAEDVRWGRTYESYSENVEVVTALGASAVRGLQENGVAACIKHYMGEGQTANGRNQGNATLSNADIQRILPPYRAAIEAGAMSLMPSFSSVNGIKMHEHKELLTDVLKEQLGFKGFVISDWAAIEQLSGGSYKAKIANAINAGVDMVMATNGRDNWVNFIRNLQVLVNEGTVPMSRIDDAVMRILKFKKDLGLFDKPMIEKSGAIGTAENRAAAREIVADSLVLLRNENNIVSRLPSLKNILVAGDSANNIGIQCGGWTISWQGASGAITKGTTVLQGIQNAAKGANITYTADGNARGSYDAVIAVIGEAPYAETEGDRFDNINIRSIDMNMLQQAYRHKCPVIVVMMSGRPMTIGNEYQKWDGFIAAWLPGTEGDGIAEVLFSDRNFTGRTPYTWRKTINGEVLYPFGFGLSK